MLIYVVSEFSKTGKIVACEAPDDAQPPMVRTARYGVLYRDQWFVTRKQAVVFLRAKYAKDLATAERRLARLRELKAETERPDGPELAS